MQEPINSRRRRASIAAFLVAYAGSAALSGPPTNEWLLAESGAWTNPTRWSLGVAPGLPGAINADARIAATGSPYTITLNTLAALNTFALTSTDATVSVVSGGVLELAGSATIGDHADPSVGGVLLLNNGTIRGGTWSILGTGALRVQGNQPSRIEGATVLGDVRIDTGGFLRVANSSLESVRMTGDSSVLEFEGSAPLHGSLLFEGPGTLLRIVRTTADDGVIHFASAAVVETAADFAGRGFIGTVGYTNESIVNDGRISALSGSINLGASTITNNGVIQAHNASFITTSAAFVNTSSIDVHNGVFTAASNDPFSSLGIQNSGAITAVDSTLNIGNGVINTGTIDALRSTVFIDASRLNSTGRFDLVDSTLRVAGEFTLADLSQITRSNSTVAIAGTLLNENQTLDLASLPDRISLDGGILRGGSVVAWDASLSVSSNLSNTLDGVAYSGRIALDQGNAFLRVHNGSTIEGLVDMVTGSPELRFDGSTTLNTIGIMMGGTQHWLSSETAGQTLTFGPNTFVNGTGLANGPRWAAGVPFETLVNEGGWNVRGGYYWQLQTAANLVNRGTITIDPSGELVTTTGLDLAQGQLNIAPGGKLTVVRLGAGRPLDASFFSGGIMNQGVIAIGATIDLQGQSITLNAEHGDVRLGSNFFSNLSAEARNGEIHIGDGASLTLDRGPIALRDLTITGGVTINPNANATLLNVLADRVDIIDGNVSVVGSAIAETRFARGTITATDLAELGHLMLPGAANRTIRLASSSAGVAQAGQVTFDPTSRLTVESTFTGSLINRTDWTLSPGSNLTLSSAAVVNDADITLAPTASLTILGALPFTNPGSITLNGGTLSIANPFQFGELLNDRNDLSTGRVIVNRSIDLNGQTLALGASDGQWGLGSRQSLTNGVVDNRDGQAFLVFGSSSSFQPFTRLANIEFTGDVVASSIVRLGDGVRFRSMTTDDEIILESNARLNGMLVQQENRFVDIRLETPASGVVTISESGGITATGNPTGTTSRNLQILAPTGVDTLRNHGEIVVKRAGRMDSYGVSRLENHGLFAIEQFASLYLEDMSVFNFGDIRLNSRTRVEIRGDLVLGEDSSIRFELGEPNTSSPGLVATGNAYLDGVLEIAITDDTTIALGQRWDLLHTNQVHGAFDAVLFDTLANPELRLMLRASDVPSDPSLEVLVRHIADLNADMVVDMSDLNLVLNGYGASGSLLAGDANADGVVDFNDLNIVLANFGRTFFGSTVPGPGSALILAAAASALAPRRRRHPLSGRADSR